MHPSRATPPRLLRRLYVGSIVLAACASTGCSDRGAGSDAGRDSGAGSYSLRACAAGEAPVPAGDGGQECASVGASRGASAAEWPDIAGATAPVVFVRAGASGGDGTMSQPFGTIAAALAATPAARTIALSRGRHELAGTLAPGAALTLLGAGADEATGTTLAVLAGATMVDVNAPLQIELAHLGLRYATDAAAAMSAAVHASAGATLVLTDVVIERAWEGVRVEGASTLRATGLSVLEARFRGVGLAGASHGAIERLLVDGVHVAAEAGGVGLFALDSQVTLRGALVRGAERGGVALLGAIAMPASPEGVEVDRIEQLAVLDSGLVGLRAEQSTAGARGAFVEASRIAVAGTSLPPGAVGGGDGIYVGPGATLVLDPGVASDAERGHGSLLVGNARAGLLADGSGARVTVTGALVGSNRGPGIFVQHAAEAARIAFSDVVDNVALGVGVTSNAVLVSFQCNGARGTRMGPLATTIGVFQLGDGLSMSEGTPQVSTIEGNVIEGNARFGMLFSGVNATLARNHGEGNGFALGQYGSTVSVDASNTVLGTAAAPTVAPSTARGLLQ